MIESALIDRSVSKAKVLDKFQFERVGYFSLDPDSTADKVWLSKTPTSGRKTIVKLDLKQHACKTITLFLKDCIDAWSLLIPP